MTDILIRDVPDDVVAAIDARGTARRLVPHGVPPQDAGTRAGPERHDRGRPDPVRGHVRRSRRSRGDARRMAMTGWLIDKSALVRLGSSPDAEQRAERIQRGLVRISTVTRLEVGFSARSADDLRRALDEPPLRSMPVEHLTPTAEDRAVGRAARAGRSRTAPRTVDPRPPDRRERRARATHRAARRQGLRSHRRDHGTTGRTAGGRAPVIRLVAASRGRRR